MFKKPKRKKRDCLKCRRMFWSKDPARNRICNECNKKNSTIYCREIAGPKLFTDGRYTQ